MKSGRIRQFYCYYKNVSKRRPFLVSAIQAGTLMGLGDFISQTVLEKNSIKSVKPVRILRFAAVGFFMCGPALRLWFGILHKYVGITDKPTTRNRARAAFKKVLIDQGIFAPIYLFVLLITVGLAQGKSSAQLKEDMQEKYFEVLRANYFIWPFLQLVNFYFIPLEHQVLVGSIQALSWDTYLAWKMNRQSQSK